MAAPPGNSTLRRPRRPAGPAIQSAERVSPRPLRRKIAPRPRRRSVDSRLDHVSREYTTPAHDRPRVRAGHPHSSPLALGGPARAVKPRRSLCTTGGVAQASRICPAVPTIGQTRVRLGNRNRARDAGTPPSLPATGYERSLRIESRRATRPANALPPSTRAGPTRTPQPAQRGPTSEAQRARGEEVPRSRVARRSGRQRRVNAGLAANGRAKDRRAFRFRRGREEVPRQLQSSSAVQPSAPTGHVKVLGACICTGRDHIRRTTRFRITQIRSVTGAGRWDYGPERSRLPAGVAARIYLASVPRNNCQNGTN